MNPISSSPSWSSSRDEKEIQREKSSTEGLIQKLTYKKLRKLGSGIAGKVYLYQCVETHKQLAVKVSKGKHSNVKSEYEVSLKWPKGTNGLLLRPKAYFVNEERDFYVMHRYDGNIQDVLSQLTPQEKIEAILQLCQGLSTLHALGIAHGDVHLANIFLDKKKNRFDLGDLGRAVTRETHETRFNDIVENDLKDLKEAIESIIIGEKVDSLQYMLQGYKSRIHHLKDVHKHGFDLKVSTYFLEFMLHTPKSASEIFQHFSKIRSV